MKFTPSPPLLLFNNMLAIGYESKANPKSNLQAEYLNLQRSYQLTQQFNLHLTGWSSIYQ